MRGSRGINPHGESPLPMQIPNIVLLADAAVRNLRSAIKVALRVQAKLIDWAQVAYTSARRANLRLFGVKRPQA